MSSLFARHALTLVGIKRSPLDTPASVIRKAAKDTALREIDSQRMQFRPLAVMADWDSQERTYRTLDRHYEIRQLRIFQKMVEKGACACSIYIVDPINFEFDIQAKFIVNTDLYTTRLHRIPLLLKQSSNTRTTMFLIPFMSSSTSLNPVAVRYEN